MDIITCSAEQVGGGNDGVEARRLGNKPGVVWTRWKQHITVIYGVQEDHYGRFNPTLMDASKCLLS